jgi:hypothetical protein
MRETILKDVLRAFLATLAAVLIYSLAGATGPSLLVVLNAFSVVVLYFSVRRGEIFGAFLCSRSCSGSSSRPSSASSP